MDGIVTHVYCKQLTRVMENGEWMQLSHPYTVSIYHVERRMDEIVTNVYCKHLTRGWRMDADGTRVYCKQLTPSMENGWNHHTRIL